MSVYDDKTTMSLYVDRTSKSPYDDTSLPVISPNSTGQSMHAGEVVGRCNGLEEAARSDSG